MRIRGYIDGVVGDELVGWVLDMDEPGRRLIVSGTFDGVAVGPVRAQEPRRDLLSAEIGDGNAGFRIPLPTYPGPGDHAVAVVVTDSGEPVPLVHDWIIQGSGGEPVRGAALVSVAPVVTESLPTPPPEPDQPALAEPVAPVVAPRPAARRTAHAPTGAAIIGADGWLYPEPSAASAADLAATAREAHALADGAVCVVAPLPHKAVAYPEHAPAGLADLDPGLQAQADLFDDDVAALLHLGPALQAARRHGRVFPRTGRHLSWLGAHHAARAIAKQLAPAVPGLLPLPALDLQAAQPVEDSLAAAPRAAFIDGSVVALGALPPDGPDDSEPALGTLPKPARADAKAVIVHGPAGARVAELLATQFQDAKRVSPADARKALGGRRGPGVVIWLGG